MPQFSRGVSTMVISMSWGEMPQVSPIYAYRARISAFLASVLRPENIEISMIV